MKSLAAFFDSRKTIAALFATVLIGIPLWFGWGDWTRAERQKQLSDAVYAVSIVWGVHIAGNAYEDGKQKSAGKPGTQVNVGSEVTNDASAAAAAATQEASGAKGAGATAAPTPVTPPPVASLTPEQRLEVSKLFQQSFDAHAARVIRQRQNADAVAASLGARPAVTAAVPPPKPAITTPAEDDNEA